MLLRKCQILELKWLGINGHNSHIMWFVFRIFFSFDVAHQMKMEADGTIYLRLSAYLMLKQCLQSICIFSHPPSSWMQSKFESPFPSAPETCIKYCHQMLGHKTFNNYFVKTKTFSGFDKIIFCIQIWIQISILDCHGQSTLWGIGIRKVSCLTKGSHSSPKRVIFWWNISIFRVIYQPFELKNKTKSMPFKFKNNIQSVPT